jgi:hypothetical protein
MVEKHGKCRHQLGDTLVFRTPHDTPPGAFQGNDPVCLAG